MADKLAALLDKAAKHLDDKPAQALAALVSAWAERPTSELMELVERFELAHPPPPFEGDTKAFVKAAKKPSALEAGSLVRALVGPKSADTIERLSAVGAWSPDPRVARALEKLLREVPWTSDATRPVWAEVFAVLVRLADPRWPALAKELPGEWKFRENQREWLGKQLAAAVEKIAAARAKKPVAPLGAAEQKAVAALAARLVPAKPKEGEKNEQGLLADIYARPNDDAPRLVYADWLLERADPRGEFITLQFKQDKDKAELKREAELLKKHGKQWLGPLANVTLKDVEWRRGFPAVVTARFKHQRDAETYGSLPEWATIERIAWSPSGAASASEHRWIYFVPPTLQPRALETHEAGLVQLLDAKRTWPMEELSISAHDVEVVRRLRESKQFPNVTLLSFDESIGPGVLKGSWLERVPRIVLRAHNADLDLGRWLGQLSAAGAQEFTVGNEWWWGRLSFTRGADGALSVLRLEPPTQQRNDQSANLLARLPDGWLTAFDAPSASDAAKKVLASKTRAKGAPAPKVEVAQGISAQFKRAVALGWFGDAWFVVEQHRLVELDAKTGAPRRESAINPPVAAAFTPDGKSVVLGDYRKLEWRDVATGALQRTTRLDSTTRNLEWAPGQRWLLITGEKEALALAPPETRGRSVKFGAYPNKPMNIALSPDGEYFAAAMYSDDFGVYAPDAKRVRKIKLPKMLQDVVFIDQRLVFTAGRDGLARVFDVASEAVEPVKTFELGEAWGCTVSPSGRRLFVGSKEGLHVFELPSLEKKGVAPVTGVFCVSPDERRLLAVNPKDGALRTVELP